MIEDADLFPQETTRVGARNLIRNGLMQNDMDADGFQILNLNTSNLVIPGIPSQPPVTNKWFNSYDSGSKTFGTLQPAFTNIAGGLTLNQQSAITRLGTIVMGTWHGSVITHNYLPRLNEILAPNNAVFLNNKRIVSLSDPVSDLDAVNLQTLNGRTIGPPNPKAAVAAATTTNIGLATLLHPVDGYTLQEGDRVLVKNQVQQYANGIYDAHAGAWTRSADFDGIVNGLPDTSDLVAATCFVLNGTVNIGTTWLMVTDPPITLGFGGSNIVWHLAQTTLSLSAGDGLEIVGNTINALGTANRIAVGATIDIAANYIGQPSITTLGTISTGHWNGDVVDGEHGGTGVANTGKSIAIDGDFTVALAPIADPDALPENYLFFEITGSTQLRLPRVGTLASLDGNEIFTNKHISADQIDSGVLPLNRGGTGADTKQAALNNLLPDQTGHAGQFLITDGAGNVSWANPSGGA